MVKTFVLDTNILLHDSKSLDCFGNNEVIIPLIVLEELDRHKSRFDDAGRNARAVSRYLDKLREGGSLFDGVKTKTKGIIKVASFDSIKAKKIKNSELDETKVDNQLISFVKLLNSFKKKQCVLVTRDINLRLKCDAAGILSEDFLNAHPIEKVDDFYKGVDTVEVSGDVIAQFFETNKCTVEGKFYPNQILILKHDTKTSAIGKFQNGLIVPIRKPAAVHGLIPRNKEQNFSLDLLLDPSISLVTLSGNAGCGKTLLALAAGLSQLKEFGDQGRYDKVVISRPIQPMGKDIGYLPGTIEEKMDPWLAPIRDNLNFLLGVKKEVTPGKKSKQPPDIISSEPYISLLQQKGKIEIEALTYIRGRSIPNAYFIIDEAQNLTNHELKTILTRAGEGTKIVLTGDLHQLDNNSIDIFSSGLTHTIEKFKNESLAGHIQLLKGERSALATRASEIL